MTKANGMAAILKPHINLYNGTPRFKLQPADINKWIDSYYSLLLRYAAIADSFQLDTIVIGTEINLIADSPQFRAMLQKFRSIYNGTTIYAASFDHFLQTNIWNFIDIIGINTYYNLCNNNDCTLPELMESWNYWLTIIDNFSTGWNKPLIITEIGFYSREGSAINPGDFSRGGKISYENQAKAYEAVLSQTGHINNIKGIFWWQWELNNEWANDSADYTPENKPAQEIIRKYWYEDNED
jgi:hypothetical protein